MRQNDCCQDTWGHVPLVPQPFLLGPCLRLSVGSYPAGRDPLRLVLRLAHRRQQLDAGILQLVVDDHVIKKLPVLRLHLPSCFFHLLEVFILMEETESQISASLSNKHVHFSLFHLSASSF